MYPDIHIDETNDLAYITFSDQKIINSIESEDELLVFDVVESQCQLKEG